MALAAHQLHRGPGRAERDLRGARGLLRLGRDDLRPLRQPGLYPERLHSRGGLRIEQTDVSYTIPDENIYYEGTDAYDYFEVFPNVKLSVTLAGENRLVAAYNRRIDRPGEPELRIFPKYDDPELLKVGNPFLRPQLTDVVELGFARSWDGGSIRTAVYLRDIDDAFLRVFAIDDSNPSYDIVNKIYQNAGSSTQTGVELALEQQLTPGWRLSGSLHLYRNEIDALDTVLLFPTERPFSLAASQDDTWDVTVNNRFELPTPERFSCLTSTTPSATSPRGGSGRALRWTSPSVGRSWATAASCCSR